MKRLTILTIVFAISLASIAQKDTTGFVFTTIKENKVTSVKKPKSLIDLLVILGVGFSRSRTFAYEQRRPRLFGNVCCLSYNDRQSRELRPSARREQLFARWQLLRRTLLLETLRHSPRQGDARRRNVRRHSG